MNKIKITLYLILILSILGGLFLIIKTPMKNSLTPLEEGKYKLQEFDLPLTMHIKENQKNLNGIFLNIKDSNINDIDYKITITDNNGKTYFTKEFKNYNLNNIIINFENIKYPNNLELILKIDSKEKNKIQLPALKSKTNYIESSNYILDASEYHFVKNYGYLWYIFMGIIVSIILLLSLERKEK